MFNFQYPWPCVLPFFIFIVRLTGSWSERLFGIIETFLIFWLCGKQILSILLCINWFLLCYVNNFLSGFSFRQIFVRPYFCFSFIKYCKSNMWVLFGLPPCLSKSRSSTMLKAPPRIMFSFMFMYCFICLEKWYFSKVKLRENSSFFVFIYSINF